MVHQLIGHRKKVTSVAWAPNGRYIASVSYSRLIIWEAKEPFQQLVMVKAHSNWIESVAWHPDSTHLATGSWERTVKVWKVEQTES